jgi:hypothetical protein
MSDIQLARLKKYIEDQMPLCELRCVSDDKLRGLIAVVSSGMSDEDMAHYRLLAARVDRLEAENAQYRRLLAKS